MSQTAGTTGNADEAGAFVSMENLQPFAKIVFGDGAHEVARCGDGATLAYRPEGFSGEWTSLGMQLEEGWPRIGGGIILSQSNALERFVRTHVVKIEEHRDDGAVEYKLEDVAWLIRETDDPNLVEIRVGSGAWTTVKIKEISMEKEKDRAVAALVKVSPDLEMEVSADMVGWAERLGAGAQIMPVL
ncbi:hypothetical protein [Donghicola sp.]|jgi:hypothetical protein|uniref:hypothetical protein n=1 Tax=Donghicola sp. TaxID=1929294 RepID=UPI0025F9085C|nr:hypothetical protein [Donghicola sp.]MCT4579064.1 hypothetical protein [Donghicola sp.]